MAYKKLRHKSEHEYRFLFTSIYCDRKNPIITFDGITVKFYPDQFDHAFYESEDWIQKDKSIFSFNRAERILWIKDALEDSEADLRFGWNNFNKLTDRTIRVAIVKVNYVVLIKMFEGNRAKFISAYEAYDTIDNILKNPKWGL